MSYQAVRAINLDDVEEKCRQATTKKPGATVVQQEVSTSNDLRLDPLGFDEWKSHHPEQAKINFERAEVLCRKEEEKRKTKASAKQQPIWLGMSDINSGNLIDS